MVSLIVPAYNAEPYIAECLSSIRDQSHHAWEAIVVDDGSTDRTGDICDRFAREDSRFRVIHTPNAGVCHARNEALRVSSGDIIGFADADDTLESGALELIVNQFDREGIDALFTGYHRTDRHGTIRSTRTGSCIHAGNALEAAEMTLDTGAGSYTGVVWNKFFLRKCVFCNGCLIEFDSNIRIGEDQIWLLLVIRNIRSFSAIPNAVYNYRIHEDSTMHAKADAETRRMEIPAREKMIELTKALYPSLLGTAGVKYRECVSRIIREEIKEYGSAAIRQLSRFGKKYYPEYMRSDRPLRSKARETLLQTAYLFCRSENPHGEGTV